MLRGRGGPKSIFNILLFLIIEENGSYQELFSEWKNIVPSQNTYNNIAHRNFNRDFPKINFKIYLLLHFLS